MLIDTPGMREVGILAGNDGIDDNFDDIHDLSLQCRFTNCGHGNERGCAVSKAIKEGGLHLERYQNYVKLKTKSEINENLNSHKGKKNRLSEHVIRRVRKRTSKS